MDVFLARGCGQLSVELCKGVYGKELFHSIKRAGLHAKHELGLITNGQSSSPTVSRWPSPACGGEAANPSPFRPSIVPPRGRELDPPTEHKIEARGRAPTTFLIKVFGSAYRLEHVQERVKFLRPSVKLMRRTRMLSLSPTAASYLRR